MYVNGSLSAGAFRKPGAYGDLDIWAQPNFNGHDNGGAFKPFNANAFYLFDFTRATGHYSTDWSYLTPHTGPNAWLVIAISRFIDAARKKGTPTATLQPYIEFIQKIGNGMQALQNPNFVNPPEEKTDHGSTQGGIRYAPLKTYDPGGIDPFNAINTENNISALAAINALFAITGDSRYKAGRDSIVSWLQNAVIYMPNAPIDRGDPSGFGRSPTHPKLQASQARHGLLDPNTGMLYTGVTYNPAHKRWEIQVDTQNRPLVATDSGGTWTTSALGSQTIDSLFGKGAAYKMYVSVRQLTGRTAVRSANGTITGMKFAGSTGQLDGFDYSQIYPENESLITPEWTAGGINAVKELLAYYDTGAGKNQLTNAQIDGLKTDMANMKKFITENSNPYAIGPGLGGSRQGQTGFGWYSPSVDETAMASIYQTLTDPLAWARQL
jgi:hypothetical protein